MGEALSAAVAGLSAGGTYALLGVCAVFTYRLVAVVNFTGAAIGTSGTFAMVMLHQVGVPLALAVAAGLVAGTLTGVAIGFVTTTWFAEADASSKAAVTVALFIGIVAVGLRLTGGQHPHPFPDLVPGSALRVAGVELTNAAIVALALALVFTLLADLFLRTTRTGLHLRALSERPVAAELLGVRVRRLSLLVWGVTGAFTTLALMIVAPQRSPDFMSLSLLVVPALAAALIGFFRNFWATLAGGVLIGVLEGMASLLGGTNQYRGALPFVVILAVLLWAQRGARWDEAR